MTRTLARRISRLTFINRLDAIEDMLAGFIRHIHTVAYRSEFDEEGEIDAELVQRLRETGLAVAWAYETGRLTTNACLALRRVTPIGFVSLVLRLAQKTKVMGEVPATLNSMYPD